jgi:hypothetical protein
VTVLLERCSLNLIDIPHHRKSHSDSDGSSKLPNPTGLDGLSLPAFRRFAQQLSDGSDFDSLTQTAGSRTPGRRGSAPAGCLWPLPGRLSH